jgi:hypothetical protein
MSRIVAATTAACLAVGPVAAQKAAAPRAPASPIFPPPQPAKPLAGEARFVGFYQAEQLIVRARSTRTNKFDGNIVVNMRITGGQVTATLEGSGIGESLYSGSRTGNRCVLTSSRRDATFDGTCDERGFVGTIRSAPDVNNAWSMQIDTAFIDVKDGIRYFDSRHLNPVYGRVVRSEYALKQGWYRGKMTCSGIERQLTVRVFAPDYNGQRGKISQLASSMVDYDVEIVADANNSLTGEGNRYRFVPTSSINVIDYERKRHDLRHFGITAVRDKGNLYGTLSDPSCSAVALQYSSGETGLTMSPETFEMLSETLLKYALTPKGPPRCKGGVMVKSGIPGHLECAFGTEP